MKDFIKKFIENKRNVIILATTVGVILLALILILIFKPKDNGGEQMKYAEWINYLNQAEITEVTVTRDRKASLGDSEDYSETVTLTTEDLKKVFKKLNDYKIRKEYIGAIAGNNKDSLKITYTVNNAVHTFRVFYGNMIQLNELDEGMIQALNNSTIEVTGEDLKDTEGYTPVYKFDNENIFNIFDEYFKVK